MNTRLATLTATICLIILPFVIMAQDTLAGWTFPSGQPADTIADLHNSANIGRAIRTSGGVSGQTTFTNGATTYAATATGWENGMLTKCWFTGISTLGYQNITISSKQRSGGNNPGPRDFLVQYNVDGNWVDIPGSNVLVVNDWTGELLNVPLPASCDNQAGLVLLRWIMTSNTNSLGDPVTSAGISKIDDILIKGDIITGMNSLPGKFTVRLYPNPCGNNININGFSAEIKIRLLDVRGQELMVSENPLTSGSFDMSSYPEGIYFLQFINRDGQVHTKKVVKAYRK